jgi:tetratricopeptide (TPR) repeat protein
LADLEKHIRELQKRVEREPGSRFFVPLADEYRKAGRLADAISTLEAGLSAHAGYVAARVALARAYLEAGRIEESMAAFSKALADDPSNLVAAKALGDLHLSRGEPLEALKRYLRYRAISGDRRLDGLIQRLEGETAAAKETAPTVPPPPPSFRPTPGETPPGVVGAVALPDPMAIPPAGAPPVRHTDPFEMTEITYKRPSGPVPVATDTPEIPSRDLSLDALASSANRGEEIVTRKIRLPQAMWPFEPTPAAPPETAPGTPEPQPEREPASALRREEPSRSGGRTLADLYFGQAHYREALGIYEELLARDPSSEELRNLRDEAQRLAAESPLPTPLAGDPGRERRLAKIRVLNEWLAVIQTAAGVRKPIGNREPPIS